MRKEIAGIRIPDTEICKQAELLLEEVSPRTLTSHCYRTYYFAEMFGAGRGIRFDHEVLYVGALLHDLGLTERFDADSRFEVRGADAAREFVKTHGLSDEKAETVWDAIALHTSPEIAERKGPEVALVQLGTACDMMGVGYHRLEPEPHRSVSSRGHREFVPGPHTPGGSSAAGGGHRHMDGGCRPTNSRRHSMPDVE